MAAHSFILQLATGTFVCTAGYVAHDPIKKAIHHKPPVARVRHHTPATVPPKPVRYCLPTGISEITRIENPLPPMDSDNGVDDGEIPFSAQSIRNMADPTPVPGVTRNTPYTPPGTLLPILPVAPAVPEPSTWLMVISGLFIVGAGMRHKARKA